MPLTPDEFVNILETISNNLGSLTEEEEINIVINLVKLAALRRGTYPLFIIDAIIDVLDARQIIFNLAPTGKRQDN